MGRKSNAEEKRGQIIWALYDCLVEKGHEKVTIKEIANKAGLPPGVIHYYFKNKDEIVAKLAKAIVDKYSLELQMCLKTVATLEQRIESAIDFLIDRLIFNLSLGRVFYNLIQMAFERDELNRVLRNVLENYRQQLSGIFKEAGAGYDSKMLGASLVALTEGFSLQLMVDPTAFNRDAVSQIIRKAVVDSFNPAQ